ncbi:hypothetical protein HAX54_030507 [Datura stramonium]|uniref:Uncharacterized protein n=1 Tax=Datura stramonium TaxID=4076 RepID=A0ABS8SB97_DATST|nr:hypothetical protein [Datura stramonium]
MQECISMASIHNHQWTQKAKLSKSIILQHENLKADALGSLQVVWGKDNSEFPLTLLRIYNCTYCKGIWTRKGPYARIVTAQASSWYPSLPENHAAQLEINTFPSIDACTSQSPKEKRLKRSSKSTQEEQCKH